MGRSLAALVALALIIGARPVLAQSTIEIQYTEIADQVRPNARLVSNTRTVQVTLGANNKLSEKFRSSLGAVADREHQLSGVGATMIATGCAGHVVVSQPTSGRGQPTKTMQSAPGETDLARSAMTIPVAGDQ